MITWLYGNNRSVMQTLPESSVQCCITSPPYFGLRDYGTGTWEGGSSDCDHKRPPSGGRTPGPGLDSTGNRDSSDSCFSGVCAKCGAVRVNEIWGGMPTCRHKWGKARSISVGNAPSLRTTLTGGKEKGRNSSTLTDSGRFCVRCNAWMGELGNEPTPELFIEHLVLVFREVRRVLRPDGTLWLNLGDSYRDKQLLGVPWLTAFALKADGWQLRSEIIWNKPNGMPESVTDRPTKGHEHIFLLAKSSKYFFDADSVRTTSNIRTVWDINSEPLPLKHFAPFPQKLVSNCLLAGTRRKDVVIDPFGGAGTVSLVAEKLDRNSIYIDLNEEYQKMAKMRVVSERTGGDLRAKPVAGGIFARVLGNG